MATVSFEAVVVGIGCVGASANGLMLYALIRSKARIGSTKFVLNQMTLDLVCSLSLIFIYAMKFPTLDYSGDAGPFLCKVIASEAPLWTLLSCSTANLVVLTIERYVKIVHSLFHRKYARAWMYNVAIALTWLNLEALVCIVVPVVTSEVLDGNCSDFVEWGGGQSGRLCYAVWSFVVDFLTPLAAFVYCYTRILHVLVAGRKIIPVNVNSAVKSVGQGKVFLAQMSVVKTFLIVSICFILCWTPNRVYFFAYNLSEHVTYDSQWRYITVFAAFLNVCLNPLIYAANLDPVKKYLRQKLLSRCRNRDVENDITSIGNFTPNPETLSG